MFGRMIIEPLVQVDPGADLQSAIATLLKITETVEIVRWIEFPASVLVIAAGALAMRIHTCKPGASRQNIGHDSSTAANAA